MNTRKINKIFKNFLILFNSVCIYTILIERLMKKLTPKENSVIQWYAQVGIITTNIKVRIGFTLNELSATKIVT